MSQDNKKQSKTFQNFTKKYELQKSLCFALKYAGEKFYDENERKEITYTEKWVRDNNVFKKDKTIDAAYQNSKFYFDKLHQRFIKEALVDSLINFESIEEKFNGWKEDVANKKLIHRGANESLKDFNKRKEEQDKIIRSRKKKFLARMIRAANLKS